MSSSGGTNWMQLVAATAIGAAVSYVVTREGADQHQSPSDDEDDDPVCGNLTDNLIAEGLSFILGKAQESSQKSKNSYSRFKK